MDLDQWHLRRFVRWIDSSQYDDTDHFYTTVLFRVGKPPIQLPINYATGGFVGIQDGVRLRPWRDTLVDIVNEVTPHYINPSHVVRGFLIWICKHQ